MFVTSVILGSSIWINPSLAVTADNHNWIGIEPNILKDFDHHTQGQLAKQVYWQNFVQDHPKWQARFDQDTFRPIRAWGDGIYFDDASQEALALQLQVFFDQYSLAGIKSSHLRLRELNYDQNTDRWYGFWNQTFALAQGVWNDVTNTQINEVPVWRSGVHVRLANQHLTMLGVDTHPNISNHFSVQVSALEALKIAQKQGPAKEASHWNTSVSLVLLPWKETEVSHKEAVLEYHLCWLVHSETYHPRGKWVSFVDAETGLLRNVYNEVRFLEGSILAEHDTRTVNGEMSLSPLPLLNIDGTTNRSDADGIYALDTDVASLMVALSGRRALVNNQAGDDAALELVGGEQLWTEEHAHQAELDQYVFQNQIYEWASEWAPQIPNAWPRATINVNLAETCNAYFDGELNFYNAGDGCNNTGRIADVAFHEWGHGFHYYNLLSGEYDGTMSEGIGDTISFFQTNDYRLAPYFTTNGQYLRNVETDLVYPEDVINEVHRDGLIFAGAVWDWWSLMKEEYGEEEAYARVIPTFVNGLRGGPLLTTVFDEFVFADDDNADLSDGTPHQCSLIEAFMRHGLGPNGGEGLLSMEHSVLSNQGSGLSGFDLAASVIQFAPQCVTETVESAKVIYSFDEGLSWEETELALNGEAITGQIPALMENSVVQYYLELETSQTNITIPTHPNRNPFTFYVGEVEEIFCNDFEDDDGGFTHSLLSGDVQDGADDWMWGQPMGQGGDPDYAASGNHVWGNDLGGEVDGQQYNGEYQNRKHNQLLSPSIDVSAYDQIVLSYDRWLTVEDGMYDQAIITLNDTEIWRNHVSSQNTGDEHHQDRQWQLHSLLVDVTGQSHAQFSWEINSDQGLTMGGWNIDNVCIYGIPKPDPLIEDEADGRKFGCMSLSSVDMTLWLGLLMVPIIRRRESCFLR